MLPSEHAQGALRLNLVGREPNGKIKPGEDMDRFCESLEKDSMAIVNVETGEPIAEKIVRTDDFYSGPCRDQLPDLIIEWNNRSPVSVITSEKIGTLEGQIKSQRTGDHRWEGLIVAVGPHITAGILPTPTRIIDFAPTIGRLLGVELPDLDGESVDILLPKAEAPLAV